MVEPISVTFVLSVIALILFGMFVTNCVRLHRQKQKRWNRRKR